YNEAVLAFRQERQSVRILASSQIPSLWQRVKSYLMNFLRFFHRLFVREKYRDIATLRAGRIPADRVDFPSLMIHELGHVPGLNHVEGPSSSRRKDYSVMDPDLAYGQIRRNIGHYDLQNMFCGYYGGQ
ncbi:MAG: hypothetical protein OXB86_04830, partial [Bdellovibrionales bacterium]|nr:hypothetical protein [Bdellovibrionales bacterium]